MPLATKVSFGPGDIVLDWDPASHPKKGTTPPIFGPCLLWPNGWIDQDATLYEVSHGPGDIVLHGDPAPPKAYSPQFSARVYCDHRSPISATAEHLFYNADQRGPICIPYILRGENLQICSKVGRWCDFELM